MDEKKKPGRGIGILIGVAPKKSDEGEDSEESAEKDGDMELKRTAAKAMLAAFKANDEEALVEAMDAYMSC